jgi:hypothetical protein
MMKLSVLVAAVLVLAFGVAMADPSGDNVVINEIYPDPTSYYDGAEYIELYNPTPDPIDIGGWVLCGVEYDQLCGGEDRWQFPVGTTIAAGGYITVAKDGADGDDGYYEEFGIYPDFEMFDSSFLYDDDSAFVANMVLLDPDPAETYSDEIQLVGGKGYGIMCGGTSQADVVYLYTTASLITLVDLVEYADMDICTEDPCFGDDGLIDNAFDEIPYLGNTLGRDDSSNDTDSSITDWQMQAPTPGAENIQNTPPWIRSVRYSPIPPMDTDAVDVTAVVTDDGVIDSVMVYYRVDEGSWGKVAASTPDTLYTGTIAAQANGAQVEYFVRAVDNHGAGINYPSEGFADPYAYSVGFTTIYDVQFVPPGGDASPLEGRTVNVTGIVTAAKGQFSDSFCMIHEGNGIFEGIKIYATYNYDGEINEGDEITASGFVTEYYGETEIYLPFGDALTVLSTGNADYGYAAVTTADVDPDDPDSEQYEGQLVSVSDVTVTAEPDGYGQWYIEDASAVGAMVDDYGYYSYDPHLFDVLEKVRGILMYSYDQFKIEPRYDDDIVGPPRIADVRYSPIPPVVGNVTITADITDNQSISSATLNYALSPSGPWSQEPMTEAREIYSAQIGPWEDGDRVYYFVEASDGSMTARKPTEGSYSFYVGMVDIYDIQFVAAPDVDDTSPLDTLAVNTTGIVTAEPGVYSDYYFIIQTEDLPRGAWQGIKVYDRTGSASFERGDEVIVCGKVQENWGETEISLHFVEAAVLVESRGDMPDPISINTVELQTKTTGEQYEGVYVYAENATVEVADLGGGYGEWAITNGAAGDTCRVDDDAEYTYDPVEGDNVYVLGTVMFTYGNYKIEPRGDEDIAVNPVGVDDGIVGAKLDLGQNMPNPFNPKTTIAFTLPEPTDVTIEVYDVAGRKIVTLMNDRLGSGGHFVEWSGRGDNGEKVASGVYFYRLLAGDEDISKKMVLLK